MLFLRIFLAREFLVWVTAMTLPCAVLIYSVMWKRTAGRFFLYVVVCTPRSGASPCILCQCLALKWKTNAILSSGRIQEFGSIPLKVCIAGFLTQRGRKFILIQHLPETCLSGNGRHLYLFCLCAERVSTQWQVFTALCVHLPPTDLQDVSRNRLKRKVTSACSSKWIYRNFSRWLTF